MSLTSAGIVGLVPQVLDKDHRSNIKYSHMQLGHFRVRLTVTRFDAVGIQPRISQARHAGP